MARKESPVANRRIGGGLFDRTDTHELTETPETPKIKRTKRTYHLPEDVVLQLNELQLSQYRATGAKPELSDLVADAIQLLAESRQQEVQQSEKQSS